MFDFQLEEKVWFWVLLVIPVIILLVWDASVLEIPEHKGVLLKASY